MKEQMKRGQVSGFEQALERQHITLTPEQRQKTIAQLNGMADEVFRQMPYDEMLDATAQIYQKHFTSSDVKGLIAFYQSEVGKKFLAEMPSLMQESMRAGGDIMQKRMPALIESIDKRTEQMMQELERSQSGSEHTQPSKPTPKQ
jgi:uncharacterized protein